MYPMCEGERPDVWEIDEPVPGQPGARVVTPVPWWRWWALFFWKVVLPDQHWWMRQGRRLYRVE